jgi:predicted DCC family thiol-disulfide oxidoreductase YuxK
LVVLTYDGRLLARSDATAHVLGRLGGAWPVLGALLAAVPRALRDAAYDAVARSRHRLFERPGAACPVVSPQLRARFDP